MDKIPTPSEPLFTFDGTPTRSWWRYWNSLLPAQSGGSDQPDSGAAVTIAMLEDRIAALEGIISQLLTTNQSDQTPPNLAGLWGAVESLSDRVGAEEARWLPADIYVVTQSNGALSSLSISTDNGLLLTNQTNDAAAQAGTLGNSPTAGNPAFWLRVKVNGTNYATPLWTA